MIAKNNNAAIAMNAGGFYDPDWNSNGALPHGTVISNVKIDKPHKFSTACNIATQIIAQVASSQYGGQTVNIAHLSPFVEESRKTFRERYKSLGLSEDEIIDKVIDEMCCMHGRR